MSNNFQNFYAEVFTDRISGRIYQKRTLRYPFFLPFIMGVLILALVLFYVWQRTQVVHLGYQIEYLKKEKVALIRNNKELLIEVASLTSPARIESLASSRIGLSTPQREQIVVVQRMAPALPGSQKEKPSDMVAWFNSFLNRNRS